MIRVCGFWHKVMHVPLTAMLVQNRCQHRRTERATMLHCQHEKLSRRNGSFSVCHNVGSLLFAVSVLRSALVPRSMILNEWN